MELDVRLTADGALAIHHDAEVPGLGPVSELAVSQLPAHVPLLAGALAVCEGMVVNVEIKNAPGDAGYDPGEAVAALTAAAIDDAGWSERVIVSSFQADTLRAVRAADPGAGPGRAVAPGARGGPAGRPGPGGGGRLAGRPPVRVLGHPRAGGRGPRAGRSP